ncbi:MAG: hypothetical protein NTV54_11985 [Ignavibacteriales bacterium]|nr:hypothetical protein [Ignavibacteriales bacterium]
MKKRFLLVMAILSVAVAMLLMTGCDKKSDPVTGTNDTNPILTFSASTDTIRVVADQTNNTTYLSNGTRPFSILTAPNSAVATAVISGSTVTVLGVAAGSTSMVVKDNSSPVKTLTISITVSTGGSSTWTTSGSLSFSTTLTTTSTVRSFSVSGIANSDYTGSGGAGAIYSASSKILWVFAYKPNSYSSTADLVILELFTTAATLTTGSYSLNGTGTNYGTMIYDVRITATDTAYYMTSSGTANLTTLTSSAAAGTFSGGGMYTTGSGAFDLFTLSNGTFNVPSIAIGKAELASPGEIALRNSIESIVCNVKAHQR